jgi:hypothetical protein
VRKHFPRHRTQIVPLADLSCRANLSIKEAMRLTGLSRQKVNNHVREGHWRWFPEGARIRVITDSIFSYQNELARKYSATSEVK